MTSSFPLLNLSSEAILHVLKSMDYEEFITISLLSERAKQSVESINLYCKDPSVFISNHISLFMNFDEAGLELRFTVDDVSEGKTSGSLPVNVELRFFTLVNEVELSMKGICIKRWINHFNAVFHFSTFDCLKFGENASRFDMKELQTMFNSYDELCILSDNGSDVKSILKHFPTRRLSFDNGVFNNLENPSSVLIQNYDELVFDPEFESRNTLELDDLLVTNSKTIKIYDSNWTVKEVNRFLKHWINGSNPRLEMLGIHFHSLEVATNQTDIFKGIKCMEMPAEHTKWFKSCKGEVETVSGGYDFYRCDGTEATLTFRNCGMVEMYVWYPHCVEEAEEMEN